MLKKQLEKLEKEISTLEKEKEKLGQSYQEACESRNHELIREIGIKNKELENHIDQKYTEMGEVMDQIHS